MAGRIRVPSYRLHRQSGQAVVTLSDGQDSRRDVLLGRHGSPQSRAEYGVISEWLANGRRLRQSEADRACFSVNELLLAYWRHAEQHYRRPDGSPTDEIHCLRAALRPLKELYGHTAAKDFGPLALKAVREKMVATVDARSGRPWCRRTINLHTYRIRSVFRWGVENELVPPSVLHGLQAVRGLQAGRTEARETGPVRPVNDAWVEAVLRHVSAPVRAMIQLQRLTGMRPGEAVIMRAVDLDTSGKVWLYRPGSNQGEHGAHKTAHHGHGKVIAIGPQAQDVLKPFLMPDLTAYLFSPRAAMEACYAQWRRHPRHVGNLMRRRKKRLPGLRYTVGTYRNAIQRGCRKAGVPVWHAHQLRHTTATEIRREYGIDAARAVLGHRSPAITDVYAEIDAGKAAEVMEKLG